MIAALGSTSKPVEIKNLSCNVRANEIVFAPGLELADWSSEQATFGTSLPLMEAKSNKAVPVTLPPLEPQCVVVPASQQELPLKVGRPT